MRNFIEKYAVKNALGKRYDLFENPVSSYPTTKPLVTTIDSCAEREADQAADRVVNLWQNGSLKAPEGTSTTAPTQPLIQRRAVSPEAGAIQASPEVAQQIQSARGAGRALPATLQPSLEAAFGMDFSGVRLHTDARADGLNRELQARAFTTGQDIFFRRGEYRPGTVEGVRLLGHELGHVGQQQLSQTSAVQCQVAEPDRRSSSDSILEMLSGAIVRVDESQRSEVVITITKNGASLTPGFRVSEGRTPRRSGTTPRGLSSVRAELRPVLDSIRTSHGNGIYQIIYRRNVGGRLILQSNTRTASWPNNPPIPAAPVPVPAHPASPTLYNHFRIRTIVGGEGGEIFGGGIYTFEIQEMGINGRSSYFTFVGIGLTVGLPAGGYGTSPWTNFMTSVSMRLENFEGRGQILAGGGYVIAGSGFSALVFNCDENTPTQNVGGLGAGTGVAVGGSWFHGRWEMRD